VFPGVRPDRSLQLLVRESLGGCGSLAAGGVVMSAVQLPSGLITASAPIPPPPNSYWAKGGIYVNQVRRARALCTARPAAVVAAPFEAPEPATARACSQTAWSPPTSPLATRAVARDLS
jgi:hypothetical protein